MRSFRQNYDTEPYGSSANDKTRASFLRDTNKLIKFTIRIVACTKEQVLPLWYDEVQLDGCSLSTEKQIIAFI